ncbi:MAG: lactonase family protein [Clostridia bacterium]|nr:lactonase family protein [Clostridia bacterium]
MRFYTGCYTRMGGPGIGVCRWEHGQIALEHTYRDINDPTYVILSHDHRTLFAVGSLPDTGEGAAASYRIIGDELQLISVQKTGGKAACHLAESEDGRFLYVANYLSGSVSAFPVTDGMLGERIQLSQHTGRGPHLTRQEGPHTHQCVFRPGTNELFVCDLGIDRVMVYAQNPATGLLSYKEEIVMPGGMGPRHLVFADKDRFYVTGELDNVVRYVVNDNGWRIAAEMSVLPEGWSGENTSAAIRLHEEKLFVSNRGHDSLCSIELDAAGKMCSASWILTGGRIPRDFAFVPGGVLYAHQETGGVIASNGAALCMDGAVCICPDWTTV